MRQLRFEAACQSGLPHPKKEGSGKGSFAAEAVGRPDEQPPNVEIDKFTRMDGLFNDMSTRQRAAGSSTDEHDTQHSATSRGTCRICLLTNDIEVFNQEELGPACVPEGAVQRVKGGEPWLKPRPASSQAQ